MTTNTSHCHVILFTTHLTLLLHHYIVTNHSIPKGKEFPLMLMGILAPGSEHARPSARPPIDSSRNCWRKCLKSHLQTSPPTPHKSYLKFRNPSTTFGIFLNKIFKKTKNSPLSGPGGRGVSEFFQGLISPFFVRKKKPVKFQNSNWPPSMNGKIQLTQ
jgi:hypothetical protein